ncbi:hypothetical protein CLV28_1008 [Sediminihabitans luteus]|uniref:IPT/TIG domain-containing protein n=1 Tax=Sediminihabitans luteus TaxID=1138585 RepID=A0A2M9D0R2_9CELL|nr:hypothetical protein CLV28_1008 [Sediminihabitans luteus]GII99860.1 hypothetical protein Slu03_22380 [Sediminihabitans luteus]
MLVAGGIVAGGIVTAALLAGCASTPTVGASAACEAPSITVEPRAVAPGESVMITGEGFMSDCDDTPDGDAGDPLQGLEVVFDHDGQTYAGGTADAGPSGTLSITVPVPLDLPAGKVDVSVGTSEPETITVSPLETTGG